MSVIICSFAGLLHQVRESLLLLIVFVLCGCAWVESGVVGSDAVLVHDGQFVIQETAHGLQVIYVDQQLMNPEMIVFRWWLMPVEGGLFPQDAHEKGSSESSLALGNDESLIPWSGRSAGSGFLYRHSGILDGRRDNTLQFTIIPSEDDLHGRMWQALENHEHGVELSGVQGSMSFKPISAP